MIVTERLRLREWTDADRDPFAAMNADPRVMRYFPGTLDRTQSDDMVDRLIRHVEQHGFTLWVVEVVTSLRGSTPFAGFTGLAVPTREMPFPHEQPLVEVGWRLRPEWWGLGIATEAAQACLDFGFNAARLDEIVSFTVPANTPSRNVMTRLGMTLDGEFDHPAAGPDDWWRTHVLYRKRRANTASGA